MKMKKKGFTLVEILAVVIIIGILALLVTPLILETIESSNKKTYDEQVKRIEDTANIYATENKLEYVNGVATVTIGDLSAEGYIKLPVKDPITKGNFSEDYAVYFYQNGVFTCGNDFIDTRDNKIYSTVQIDDQCWFAENLAYTGNGCLDKTWNNSAPRDGCRKTVSVGWDNGEVLYQWWAAMNWDGVNPSTAAELAGAQGLCPNDWHVPTVNEWNALKAHLSGDSQYWCGGNSANIGKSMASTNNWTTSATACAVGNNQITNNLSGFTGLPVGYRDYNLTADLLRVGEFAGFWVSTVSTATVSWSYDLIYNNATNPADADPMTFGVSVRCLKD